MDTTIRARIRIASRTAVHMPSVFFWKSISKWPLPSQYLLEARASSSASSSKACATFGRRYRATSTRKRLPSNASSTAAKRPGTETTRKKNVPLREKKNMETWKNRLASIPKEENLKERRRFNAVARQLRNDAFPVEKTYRLAGGGMLPEAIGLLKALEKEMKALFATLKKGSTAHQVHLKEVLRLRGLLRKDPAVQELQANPKAAKGVFESLYERGKQSLYGMFRTMYRYRWTGLKVATLALIAYLAWSYFASPGTAAIVAPSKALKNTSPPRPKLPVDDVQILDDFTRQYGDTIRLPKSSFGAPVAKEPVNLDDVQILSDVTRRKPHYKNEYMEIWGKGNAKPQYDFEFFPQKKGDYDITIFPKNEEEYLVAGGKMTENERYLIDAFSAQSKQKKQRKSLMEWAKTLLTVVEKSRYQERFEGDNARIWYADKVFSTKKTTKKKQQAFVKRDKGKKKKNTSGPQVPSVETAYIEKS